MTGVVRFQMHIKLIVLCFLACLCAIPVYPQATPEKAQPATSSVSPANVASASDIAAAKAAGKVWVNLETGVYHKGGRWYGRTKNGKFMTEAEAKKAGYRESKRH
jgi:hypothetical protein